MTVTRVPAGSVAGSVILRCIARNLPWDSVRRSAGGSSFDTGNCKISNCVPSDSRFAERISPPRRTVCPEYVCDAVRSSEKEMDVLIWDSSSSGMTVGLDEQPLRRIRPVTNIQRINAWFTEFVPPLLPRRMPFSKSKPAEVDAYLFVYSLHLPLEGFR